MDTSEIDLRRVSVRTLHLQCPKTRSIAFVIKELQSGTKWSFVLWILIEVPFPLASYISIHWMSGHKYFTETVGYSTENAETSIHCSVWFHEMIVFHFLKMKYEHLHEVKDLMQLCPLLFKNASDSQIPIYCFH